MTSFLTILGLLSLIGGFGLFKHYRDKKAGRNEERVKNLEQENTKLKNRPRTDFDVIKRLSEWADRLKSKGE